MELNLQRLNTRQSGFRAVFERLLDRAQSVDAEIEAKHPGMMAFIRGAKAS